VLEASSTVARELVALAHALGAAPRLFGLYNPHELNDKTWVSGASAPLLDAFLTTCLRPLHARIAALGVRGSMAPSFGGHFVDPSWGPNNVSAFWTGVLRAVPAGLDVLMVQDGIGVASRLPPKSSTRWTNASQVVPFYRAFARAVAAAGPPGAALWSDVEIFVNHPAGDPGRYPFNGTSGPAPLSRIRRQLAAEAPVVARSTCWEWSEYLSPLNANKPEAKALYEAYKKELLDELID
jgi:hypothetical protein